MTTCRNLKDEFKWRLQEKEAVYIPASGLCAHQLADVLDDVLKHEMVTDGVWVMGEDPHKPLQEECPALVLGQLHCPINQGHLDSLEQVRLS